MNKKERKIVSECMELLQRDGCNSKKMVYNKLKNMLNNMPRGVSLYLIELSNGDSVNYIKGLDKNGLKGANLEITKNIDEAIVFYNSSDYNIFINQVEKSYGNIEIGKVYYGG